MQNLTFFFSSLSIEMQSSFKLLSFFDKIKSNKKKYFYYSKEKSNKTRIVKVTTKRMKSVIIHLEK